MDAAKSVLYVIVYFVNLNHLIQNINLLTLNLSLEINLELECLMVQSIIILEDWHILAYPVFRVVHVMMYAQLTSLFQ